MARLGLPETVWGVGIATVGSCSTASSVAGSIAGSVIGSLSRISSVGFISCLVSEGIGGFINTSVSRVASFCLLFPRAPFIFGRLLGSKLAGALPDSAVQG